LAKLAHAISSTKATAASNSQRPLLRDHRHLGVRLIESHRGLEAAHDQ